MKEELFSLETILASLYIIKNKTPKKRLIFDQTDLGGIGSKWVKVFFIALPILLYIGIFNPTIFGMLGIAQAIIFYIVFLSMIMIMIVGLTFINNNKVLRQIKPSWEKYFPSVDLTQVLSAGATPYKDFLKNYTEATEKGLKDDVLKEYMANSFKKMQEENADLYTAMNRNES